MGLGPVAAPGEATRRRPTGMTGRRLRGGAFYGLSAAATFLGVAVLVRTHRHGDR